MVTKGLLEQEGKLKKLKPVCLRGGVPWLLHDAKGWLWWADTAPEHSW